MARRLTAAIPPNFDLDSGYVLRVTALDPTTGAVVSGVTLTNVLLMVRPLTPTGSADDGSPLPLLVPTAEPE